jgi:hypothetical protein
MGLFSGIAGKDYEITFIGYEIKREGFTYLYPIPLDTLKHRYRPDSIQCRV